MTSDLVPDKGTAYIQDDIHSLYPYTWSCCQASPYTLYTLRCLETFPLIVALPFRIPPLCFVNRPRNLM